MSIDLTSEQEQDWLQSEAPPIEHSAIADEDEILERARTELIPPLASAVEQRLTSEAIKLDNNCQADYTRIAGEILHLVSDTTLKRVLRAAEKRASEAELPPRQFASLYANESAHKLLNQIDDASLQAIVSKVDTA